MTGTYNIEWSETLTRCETITAESLSEALTIAKEQYFSGKVILGAENYASGSISAKDTCTGSEISYDLCI